MRMLLVEDDVLLGRATCKGLMQVGYAVDWLTQGAQVKSALGSYDYACVLLDLGLPDVSGEVCLQAMRRENISTPVIVLTARSEKVSRISMLDIGADDYMIKPYDVDELAARVRALVRRVSPGQRESTSELSCGGLHLHVPSQTVTNNGAMVVVTSKEFWLLEALMRNRDRIVTRRQLTETLYGWDQDVSSNTIDVFIYQLRRKLGEHTIQTVRGNGYRLACSTHAQS